MADLVKYAEPIAELPADRQNSWLLMGRGKLVMDKALQAKVLELQIVLKDYATITIANVGTLTEKLALYRKLHTAIIDSRKEYTQYLDLVKEQCMKFEKQYDPEDNAEYQGAARHELLLREQATAAANSTANKNAEKASFIAHVKNEWFRIVDDYRNSLSAIVHQAYTTCLSQKIPADKIEPAIVAAKAAMKTTQPPQMVKYKRMLIPDNEAIEIFNSIAKPDWAAVYKEAIASIEDKFSMYINDLASADAVLQQTTIQFNAEQQQAKNDLAARQAATVLEESAIGSITSMPEGFKQITETSCIAIETKNPKWVAKIMAAFLANYEAAFSKLRNSDYSKINIEQMAKALDAASVKVEGINYEEIKK